MGNSAEYRRKAAAHLRGALQTSDPEMAAAYAELTIRFEWLAEWAERADDRERGNRSRVLRRSE